MNRVNTEQGVMKWTKAHVITALNVSGILSGEMALESWLMFYEMCLKNTEW